MAKRTLKIRLNGELVGTRQTERKYTVAIVGRRDAANTKSYLAYLIEDLEETRRRMENVDEKGLYHLGAYCIIDYSDKARNAKIIAKREADIAKWTALAEQGHGEWEVLACSASLANMKGELARLQKFYRGYEMFITEDVSE